MTDQDHIGQISPRTPTDFAVDLEFATYELYTAIWFNFGEEKNYDEMGSAVKTALDALLDALKASPAAAKGAT